MYSIAKSFNLWIFFCKKTQQTIWQHVHFLSHLYCVNVSFQNRFFPAWLSSCTCILLNVPLENIALIWRRHHYKGRTAKITVFTAYDLWARRDLHRVMSYVTIVRFLRSLPNGRPIYIRLARQAKGTNPHPPPSGTLFGGDKCSGL